MRYLEGINSCFSGILLPVLLIGVGIYLGIRLKFFYIFHPIRLITAIREGSKGGGTSPFRALSMALAGTLGVGNISGVATAITAGGAGAVFWMWVSAIAAMSIKYAEVSLAVIFRKSREEKGKTIYSGGAPIYIKEGLSKYTGKKTACMLSSLFAVFLIINSFLTGNIVQINAAASVSERIPSIVWGIGIGLIVITVVVGGATRIGDFTVKIIPLLSVLYIALSLYVIFSNITAVPSLFARIFKEAFSFRAAGGGVLGYGMAAAVRFGVTRGIFSNEAGCGTAPTAHACANTKSPHHQGCFGILEVFCDTVVLCTMTALVILLADIDGVDGIELSMSSFGKFCGTAGEVIIGASVVIFALATIICQSYYGIEALSFFGKKKSLSRLYIILSFGATVLGSLISSRLMWQLADLQIALMTVVNTLVVFILSDEVTGNAVKL